MKNIFILLFFSVFLFSCSQKYSENIEQIEEKVEIVDFVKDFENLSKTEDFYFYNFWDISFKFKNSDIYSVIENKTEKIDLEVSDSRNNNNFYFSIFNFDYLDVKNVEELVDFNSKNLVDNFKVENFKREKVELGGVLWEKLSYRFWWADLEEYFFEYDDKNCIKIRTSIYDESKDFADDILGIVDSINLKK